MNEIENCPKSISASVNAIMSEIKILSKDSENSFQNYKYADIDSFLGLVNPLCSKHGLNIFMNEKDCKVVGENKKWVHILYEFVLVHKDGETWNFPQQKNMFVQMTGGPSLGVSQSYALKQFMRQIFLIPTGEGDLDEAEQNFNKEKK